MPFNTDMIDPRYVGNLGSNSNFMVGQGLPGQSVLRSSLPNQVVTQEQLLGGQSAVPVASGTTQVPQAYSPQTYTAPQTTQTYSAPQTYSTPSYNPAYNIGDATYQPTTNPTLGASVVPYTPPGVYVQPTPMSFPQSNMPDWTKGESITLQSGMPGVAPFTFNMGAEQEAAYQKLKPYYDKLLSFAGGRVDLAKRMLEYSYQQGTRESQQQYGQEMGQYNLETPVEREKLRDTQNRRGIMDSGFGKTDTSRLTQAQSLRKEAIDRALENRTSKLTSERGFGLEEKQAGFNEEVFNMERNKQKEASNMAMDKYGMKSAEYQSQVAAAQAEENRRIQKEQSDFSKRLAEFTNPGFKA